MKLFYLVETVTRDKLIHQGLFYRPKNPGKKAILLVHGLTSTFYGGIKLLEALADECENAGFGLATFNNRGHDMITGIRKVDRRKPKGYGHMIGGAGYENFKDCIYDIEAGVDFLANQGFSEIIITGSSTGANKVCFYASKTKNPHVLGFVLASPSSDRLTITDKNRLEKNSAIKTLCSKSHVCNRLETQHSSNIKSCCCPARTSSPRMERCRYCNTYAIQRTQILK